MLSESEYREPSAEENLVAGVLLAGWHIDDWTIGWKRTMSNSNRYRLWSPQGRVLGHYSTRYTAALAADREMTRHAQQRHQQASQAEARTGNTLGVHV